MIPPECNADFVAAMENVLDVYKRPHNAEFPADFAAASILKDGRVVFNIAGNKYRIVLWINYPYRVVYIRFIGTHVQYDVVDAQTV